MLLRQHTASKHMSNKHKHLINQISPIPYNGWVCFKSQCLHRRPCVVGEGKRDNSCDVLYPHCRWGFCNTKLGTLNKTRSTTGI